MLYYFLDYFIKTNNGLLYFIYCNCGYRPNNLKKNTGQEELTLLGISMNWCGMAALFN